MTGEHGPRILVALDYSDPQSALDLVARLDPTRCRLKVGKELFTRGGPALVERLTGLGYEVFLDLKYHDIPNTVAGAVRAAAALGVWMVNVHALGGRRMIEAAREALEQERHRPLLIAVTILTSMAQEDIAEIGLEGTPVDNVLRLASLTQRAGADGVVCSPQEVVPLRETIGNEFTLVTPGIRPAWSATGDQKRIKTPAEAIADGADYLVIGRPITGAEDPLVALGRIEDELKG